MAVFIYKGLGAFVQNVLLASPQSDSTGSDGNQGTSGVSRYKTQLIIVSWAEFKSAKYTSIIK